ncbi:MAG TPA: coiled-coil domain-containing protein [Methylocella sp.]|nr:coiled-coil domain-containing protein [Methylocella sp.]
MSAVLFDTLRLSRTLREKGHFTAEQAETLAEALGEATHEELATKADLATLNAALKSDIAEARAELKTEISELRTELKTDIAELRTELKTEINGLRTELKTDIAGVKADILKWVVGAIGFQTAAVLGTVVALVRIFAK